MSARPAHPAKGRTWHVNSHTRVWTFLGVQRVVIGLPLAIMAGQQALQPVAGYHQPAASTCPSWCSAKQFSPFAAGVWPKAQVIPCVSEDGREHIQYSHRHLMFDQAQGPFEVAHAEMVGVEEESTLFDDGTPVERGRSKNGEISANLSVGFARNADAPIANIVSFR